MSRYIKIVLTLWVVFTVFPALTRVGAASAAVRSADGVGPSVAAYLALCPPGTAAYALAAMVLAPALLMLVALDTPRSSAPSKLWLNLGRSAALWLVLDAACLALLLILESLKGGDLRRVLGWNARIWLWLSLSALPGVALGTLFATFISKRSWRSVALGLGVVVAVGLLGRLASVSGMRWTPAGVDSLLFSGRAEDLWPGIGASLLWTAALMAAATVLVQRRARVAQ